MTFKSWKCKNVSTNHILWYMNLSIYERMVACTWLAAVRMDPVCGTAQSSAGQKVGSTGLDLCLTVLDWMGLVWTCQYTFTILTWIHSQVSLKIWLIHTVDNHLPLITHSV